MKTSETVDQLMPALLKARLEMKPAFKGKKNDHFKYNYANEEAWHDAVQPHLHAGGMLLTFSISDYTRTGSLSAVRGVARVTHVASGQWLEIEGIGEGHDNADKGAYKAQTGLKKYLYALAFSLPTSDDPEDAIHDKKRAADEVAASMPAAKQSEVNAELAKQGLQPQAVNPETKARAKALFDKAKLIDYAEANRIKRNWGTDYERMGEELDLFIAGAPKKEG